MSFWSRITGRDRKTENKAEAEKTAEESSLEELPAELSSETSPHESQEELSAVMSATGNNDSDGKGLPSKAITPESVTSPSSTTETNQSPAEDENEEQDAEGLEASSEGGRQSKADKRRNRRKKRRGKKRKAAHAAADEAERDSAPETGTEDTPATNGPVDDLSMGSNSESPAEGMKTDDAVVSDFETTAAIEEKNALSEPNDEGSSKENAEPADAPEINSSPEEVASAEAAETDASETGKGGDQNEDASEISMAEAHALQQSAEYAPGQVQGNANQDDVQASSFEDTESPHENHDVALTADVDADADDGDALFSTMVLDASDLIEDDEPSLNNVLSALREDKDPLDNPADTGDNDWTELDARWRAMRDAKI